MHNKNRLKLLSKLGKFQVKELSQYNLAGKRRFWKAVQHFLKKSVRNLTNKGNI